MPEAKHPGNRTPAQRQTDHANLARLADSLVPALVHKLASSGLGELEVSEGEWHVRLRRPLTAAPAGARRADRPRHPGHQERDGRPSREPGGVPGQGPAAQGPVARDLEPEPGTVIEHAIATSPAVGVFRPGPTPGTRVRAGDAVGSVDLLGIPQDVPSPIDGILVEVFATAGEAVEYGEEIASIEPDVPGPGGPDPVPDEGARR